MTQNQSLGLAVFLWILSFSCTNAYILVPLCSLALLLELAYWFEFVPERFTGPFLLLQAALSLVILIAIWV